MKIISGIIMIIGVIIGFGEFSSAGSAPQQAASIFYPVAFYVFARALENFSIPFVKIKENSNEVEEKEDINIKPD